MDVLDIASAIHKKVDTLIKARNCLKEYSLNKAKTMVALEKRMAIVIVELKSGKVFDVEGTKIECLIAATLEKCAKGVCHEEALEAYVAEAMYKNCIVQIEAIKAEMNGLQSIFRHLSEIHT